MDLMWQSEDAGAGKALHVHCGHRDVIKTTGRWCRTAGKIPCPSRMPELGNDLLILAPGAQEDKCTVWLSDYQMTWGSRHRERSAVNPVTPATGPG